MDDFSGEIKALRDGVGFAFKGCFLAGGAITSLFSNKKIRDYDLYFKDKASFMEAVADMYGDGCWCVSISSRAITFKKNDEFIYQLMCFSWFESPESIFERFDFTCCMAAINLETGEFHRSKDFVKDLSKRRLSFNHNTQFPLGSAMRVRKYQSRGYTIEDSEFLKVLLACSFKKIESWDQLKDQIGGQYGQAVSMNTEKDFCLENAITSMAETMIEKPAYQPVVGGGSYEEAMVTIFGATGAKSVA